MISSLAGWCLYFLWHSFVFFWHIAHLGLFVVFGKISSLHLFVNFIFWNGLWDSICYFILHLILLCIVLVFHTVCVVLYSTTTLSVLVRALFLFTDL
ncbi:hypothetical protein GYMLUDRAFT_678390 [Collybiopsis luxurians FD-317 M1]|uniref:Uncharacterized protein n=1 Tax=Collybiopsis luxurians FD-317 M1 TaxID=944289 RepID=A0A0D0BV29_9AGAR|nr:hypothetical protein GYMLUDRAFT_678390 [Collybiopsis luxurians FD-317 M1]